MRNLLLLNIGLLLLILISSCSSKGIAVTIENKSGHNIRNVVLSYRGGKKEIKEIKNDKSWSGYVNPNGESHLEIDYIDEQDIKHHSKIDCYFEKNYQGSLEIKIGKNGNLSFKDKIKIKY